MKILKTSKIEQIINKYPKLGTVLIEKYGLHCFGCMAAQFETLEEGARAHGMKNSQITTMIKELNIKIKKANSK